MQHIERLKSHIENGTLIRGAWTGEDAHGRETACLLAAMVPQCGEAQSAGACPASVMPGWLAYLTPSLDDNGSIEAWPAMVERFAALAARWHTLDEAAWRRAQFGWLGLVVREAATHTTDGVVIAICERVAALCDGVVTTGVIDAASFEEAQAAAWDVVWETVAGVERVAARAAAEAATAPFTARASAASAAEAASAPFTARAAAEAWDSFSIALFDAIEKELAPDFAHREFLSVCVDFTGA